HSPERTDESPQSNRYEDVEAHRPSVSRQPEACPVYEPEPQPPRPLPSNPAPVHSRRKEMETDEPLRIHCRSEARSRLEASLAAWRRLLPPEARHTAVRAMLLLAIAFQRLSPSG